MKEKISNLSYLQTVTDGDNTLLLEIIEIFLEQIDEFTQETKLSLDNRDWYSLGAVSHKAKSSVKSFGANDTAIILEQIESLAKGNVNKELKIKQKTRGNLDEQDQNKLSKVKIYLNNDIELKIIPHLIKDFESHCIQLKQEVEKYKEDISI